MQVDSEAVAAQAKVLIVEAGQAVLANSVASYFRGDVCGKLRFQIDAANWWAIRAENTKCCSTNHQEAVRKHGFQALLELEAAVEQTSAAVGAKLEVIVAKLEQGLLKALLVE